jgi:ABC-type amino acid transport substrate-binding protein
VSLCQIHRDLKHALKQKKIFFKQKGRRKLILLQTYDAIVGDMTILAERSRNVSFTQPYTESGLSLIFPAENEDSAWLFMKPFSWEMWGATIGILIYTMIIIWFLEHHLNPESAGGPLKNQISTTMWFTFSSLFFVHSKS